MLRNEALSMCVKDKRDVNEEKVSAKKTFEIEMNWEYFAKNFENLPAKELPSILASYLLQAPINHKILNINTNHSSNPNHGVFVKQLTIYILALPE
ncbi:MAG: hypothetical protein ACK4GN_12195 [Runella sp.]